MVGEATPKSAKAGTDESSAAPPLKILKFYSQPAKESLAAFPGHACVGSIPSGLVRNGTPASGDSALVNPSAGLTQRLLCQAPVVRSARLGHLAA